MIDYIPDYLISGCVILFTPIRLVTIWNVT